MKRDLTAERALEAGLRAELADRAAVRAAITRISTGPTPEATAELIVEALLQIDGLEHPSVFDLSARAGQVFRLAGRAPGVAIVPGEEFSDERAGYLRRRAADGPWLHVFAQEPPPGMGLGRSRDVTGPRAIGGSCAPGGVAGVVGIGSHDPLTAQSLVEHVPALATFDSILGAQLVPKLEVGGATPRARR